jgi:subtilase family serine protease
MQTPPLLRKFAILFFVAALGLGMSVAGAASPFNSSNGVVHEKVCPDVVPETAGCHSVIALSGGVANPDVIPGATPQTPASIKAIYGFPKSADAGNGKTIAIVAAYDDPTVEGDLLAATTRFGLPECNTANGCFTKVDQTGGTNYPRTNSGWALEISLDTQWAHAIAPGAKILLVEAKSAALRDLIIAENYAKTHAEYVSNSWGAAEFSRELNYDSAFSQPDVSFFVAAGDNGLPAEYPSSSPNVISVGGTTLNFDAKGRFISETGWTYGGGGCSLYESAQPIQTTISGYNCGGKRSTPDVSLDANPLSGVLVYDSTPYGSAGLTGWFLVGGTSVATPIWAARAAVSGSVIDSVTVYSNLISFRDIVSGGNAAGCLVGYDMCSGRGSWIG